MRKWNKLKSKKGQGVVEYLLVMAVVVGMLLIFKKAAEAPLSNMIDKEVKSIGADAWRGGIESYKNYYRKKHMIVQEY